MKKILYISRDDGGCGFYRCIQPARFIKRMGLAETEVVLQKTTPENIMSADLVIMQNMGSIQASAQCQFMIKNNVPFICEVDDYIHHVSPRNTAGYGAWNPGTLYIHRAVEQIRSGMGMTVATTQLGREYFPYAPEIFVSPNYLDKDLWDNPMTKRNDGKIRIGWAGGNAHADDLKMISKVIQKVVKEHKGRVIFETMGMTANELRGVFPMPATHESCPSCGFEGSLHHFPGESINEYPLTLAGKGWDIVVAPVIENGFGNAKSDIKIKEYSAIGAAIVASPIPSYREAAESNAQVLFARTFDEWYNALTELIQNESKRNDMIRKNREWIGKYWIQDNAQKVFQIYDKFIKKSEIVFGNKEKRIKQFYDNKTSNS